MATGDKTEMRAAMEITLGDEAGTEWTDPEKDNAIDEAVDDISRLMPRERISESVYRTDVTDETFTSSFGVAVALSFKPIKKGSVEVTSKPAGTTYTEYDDFTMDYANGTITVLSTGDMSDSTDHLIDYKINVPAVDISGISDLIAPLRVEWPIDEQPKSFSSFLRFEDHLMLTSRGMQSQTNIKDKDHIRVYYLAEHTAPTASAAGTYPRWLDALVVKGAIAYCLFIKARALNLQAEDDLDAARVVLVKYDDDLAVGITTAFSDADNSFGNVTSSLGLIDGGSGPLDRAVTALAKIATHSGNADNQLQSQRPLTGDVSAVSTVNAGRESNFVSAAHGLQTGDIIDSLVTSYTGRHVVRVVDDGNFIVNVAFGSTSTGFWSRESQIDDGIIQANLINTELVLINSALDKIDAELNTATRNADDYLDKGDALINQINTGLQPDQVYEAYAMTKVNMAQAYASEAAGRAQHGAQLSNEVLTRLTVIQRVLESAQVSLGVSDSYNTEAQMHVQHALVFVQEAAGHAQAGQGYIAKLQQYLALGALHLEASQVYFESARAVAETADRFLTDARERHRDYIRQLTSRVEQGRPRSHSASRQWSDSTTSRGTVPTGSET